MITKNENPVNYLIHHMEENQSIIHGIQCTKGTIPLLSGYHFLYYCLLYDFIFNCLQLPRLYNISSLLSLSLFLSCFISNESIEAITKKKKKKKKKIVKKFYKRKRIVDALALT